MLVLRLNGDYRAGVGEMRNSALAGILLLAGSLSGPDLWAQTPPPTLPVPQVTPQLRGLLEDTM